MLIIIALQQEGKKGKSKYLPAGDIGYIYMILYGIGTIFFIEFLRNDYRGEVGFLSTSQFISIFFVICGVGLLVFNKLHSKQAEAK